MAHLTKEQALELLQKQNEIKISYSIKKEQDIKAEIKAERMAEIKAAKKAFKQSQSQFKTS